MICRSCLAKRHAKCAVVILIDGNDAEYCACLCVTLAKRIGVAA